MAVETSDNYYCQDKSTWAACLKKCLENDKFEEETCGRYVFCLTGSYILTYPIVHLNKVPIDGLRISQQNWISK